MTPLSVLFVRVARLDRFHLSTWTGELVGISNFSWPAKLTQRHQWNVNETFVFQFQVVFPIIIKKSNLFLPKGPTKTKSVLWLRWLIPLEGLCNALPRMMIICVSQLSKLWLCQNQLLPCRVITNARRSECYEKCAHTREREGLRWATTQEHRVRLKDRDALRLFVISPCQLFLVESSVSFWRDGDERFNQNAKDMHKKNLEKHILSLPFFDSFFIWTFQTVGIEHSRQRSKWTNQ